MKYFAAASTALAIGGVAVSAAPSLFEAGQQQLTFVDSLKPEVDVQSILQHRKGLLNALSGNAGNVVQKGAKWIENHINDSRFTTISHAAFPNHKLRVNNRSPSICDPDVKQISGYLDIGESKHLFFWFFESRRDPQNDPLTVWLNGGPGCSSTTGLLFELGPCLIADAGNGTVYNPFSWNEVSSMLFLDQPVQVGYSYTEGPNVVTTPDAAKDFYAFVQLFLKQFPEYASLDFNIAGESYAGHYIPNFASYIYQQSVKVANNHPEMIEAAEMHHPVNLKSLLIGNGLTDPYYQFASVPEYSCPPSKTAFLDPSSCETLDNKVSTCQRLDSYCYQNPSRFTCLPAALYCWGMYSPLQATGRNLYDIRKTCNRNGEDGPLCYKELGWIEQYLNKHEVKEELGAPAEVKFESCNSELNRAFLMTGDSQHNSASLLPELLENGVRVLIYAGNQDAMCNWIGNKNWFEALNNVFSRDIKEAQDKIFLLNNKKAGKVLSAGPGAGNYTFLEIFDAGHMVPADQPEVALKMFTQWLANEAF